MSQEESQFWPDGLRVLAVDDDAVCLKLLAALLHKCRYKVTATTKATEALEILRRDPGSIDIVVTDVRMADMDGFALLEKIGLEMDLPVIMVSGSDDKETVMNGILHGACDFLIKPVRMEELQNIWQHVYRKRLFSQKSQNSTSSGKRNVVELDGAEAEDKGEDQEAEGNGEWRMSGSQKKKKARVRWDAELHGKFVEAVNRLGGGDRAVPNKILKEMSVAGVTRECVASHLQKYRNGLKRQKEAFFAMEERGTSYNYPNRLGNGHLSSVMMSMDKHPQLVNHQMERNMNLISSRSANLVLDHCTLFDIPHKIPSFSNAGGGGYGMSVGVGLGGSSFGAGSGSGDSGGSSSSGGGVWVGVGSCVGVGVGGCDIGAGIDGGGLGVGSGVGVGGGDGITKGPGSVVLPSADFGMTNPCPSFNGAPFTALEDAPFGADLRDYIHTLMMGR